MSPEQSWFITLDGREQGPFAGPAVRGLVQAGRIIATTPMRRGDLAQAIPAGRIKGVLPKAPQAPAPAAPTAVEVASAQPQTDVQFHSGVRSAAAQPEPPAPTTRQTRRTPAASAKRTPAPEPEPQPEPDADAEAHPEEIDPGRAGLRARLISLAIDLLLIGGGAAALMIVALRSAPTAEERTIGLVEAGRARQTQDQGGRGDARPTFASWPATRTAWEAEVAAKRAAVATAEAALPPPAATPAAKEPTQDEAVARVALANQRNDLEFREKTLEFETKRYAQDQEAIRAAGAAAAGTAHALLAAAAGLALLLAPLIEGLTAATPGKLVLGLRTVGAGRLPVSFGRAFLRHACRLVPGSPIGLLQRGELLAWHDRWSGTEVVSSDAVARRTRAKGKAGTDRTAKGTDRTGKGTDRTARTSGRTAKSATGRVRRG